MSHFFALMFFIPLAQNGIHPTGATSGPKLNHHLGLRANQTPCKPARSRPVSSQGFCISLQDLDDGECDAAMEISQSKDCDAFNGNLCCYRVKNENANRINTGQATKQATSPQSVDYQNSGQPPPGQRCSFPIVLPTYTLEPEKQDGAHYGYLGLKNSSIRTNPVVYYTQIGKSRTILPGSVTPAGASNSTGLYYSSSDTNSPCQAEYGPYYVAVDGRFQGYLYNSEASNTIILDNLGHYLYDDYVTLEIYLSCYAFNSRTGKCTDPDLYINTRTRPDQLTPEAKARVDQIVNDTLKPYGCSRADLLEHHWTAAKPLCSSPAPPDCYLKVEQGIKDAINGGQFVDNRS